MKIEEFVQKRIMIKKVHSHDVIKISKLSQKRSKS